LFEDNAEFGLGFRLALDSHAEEARRLLERLGSQVGDNLAGAILASAAGARKNGAPALSDQAFAAELSAQRERIAKLRAALRDSKDALARRLDTLADYLVKKSVWIVGGDGWAYDIGYGGLDHVLATGKDVNLLVLDTEVYSNTGGQQSKATPIGAAAKFATAGKEVGKKDLGLMAMSYGHVYVARVAFGAKDVQTLKALQEAESFPGPSLVIAYSHCIAHGYDMVHGADQQRLAVESGIWPLYRFDPRRVLLGEPPLHLDSGAPKASVKEYMRNETRFRMVEKLDPERFRRLMRAAERGAAQRVAIYQQLSALTVPDPRPLEQGAADDEPALVGAS
jgi:pyruvate-ferredoxin/flavodoxin oxidoreductase